MPKGSILSFGGGELTEFMDARVDTAKYRKGCRKFENFEPVPYGAALARPGTVHGGEAKYSNKAAKLIPFAFSSTTTFDIEIGDGYFRFWKDQQAVDAPTPAAWLTATAYAVDDYVVETAVSYRCIEAHTSGTFATDLTAGKWEVLTVLEVTSPYLEADIFELQFEQQNDEVYLSHPDYDDRKLVRLADDNWTLSLIDYGAEYNYPALANQNGVKADTVSVALIGAGSFSTIGQTVNVTANHDRFVASDVGDYFMISHDREITEVRHRITTDFSLVTPVTTVSIYVLGDWAFQTQGLGTFTVTFEESVDEITWTVKRQYVIEGDTMNVQTTGTELTPKFFRITIAAGATSFASTSADAPYAIIEVTEPEVPGLVKITAFTDERDVDAVVVEPLDRGDATYKWAEQYFSDKSGHARAVCFHKDRRCIASRDVWLSQPGNYENFRQRNDADSGFKVPVWVSGSPKVQWMQSLRDLRIGTSTAECVLTAENTNEVFAYDNYTLREDSNYGSKYIRSEKVNGTTLFVQPAGKTVRHQLITGIEGFYDANTLTTLADHILDEGVVQTAYQRQRYPTWHGVRSDGEVASLLYEQAQDIQAWYRMKTDGIIESISVTPRPDEEDRVAYIVQRSVNGTTKRNVEFKALNQYRILQKIGKWMEESEALGRADVPDTAAIAALEALIIANQDLMWFVDDGINTTGTDMTTITGLDHLEGETVAILADGASMPERVVASGAIALDYPCQSVTVGRPYDYCLIPMYLEDPSIMGRSKNISGAIVKLWRSGPASIKVGNEQSSVLSLPVDQENDRPSLQSGDTDKIHVAGEWDRSTTIEVSGRSPLPVNILCITLEFEVGRG